MTVDDFAPTHPAQRAPSRSPVRTTRRDAEADGTGIVIGVIAGLALWAVAVLVLVALSAKT